MKNITKTLICIALLMSSLGQASKEAPAAISGKAKELIEIAKAPDSPGDIVKTVAEFEADITKDPFLAKYHANQGPTADEITQIGEAREFQHTNFGGIFDKGRSIGDFNGNTLVVGGGKVGTSPLTALTKFTKEVNDLEMAIYSVEKHSFNFITKEVYHTKEAKDAALAKLREELQAELDRTKNRNQEILDKYYTLNIEPNTQPDILASITSINDMAKIPDGRFEKVIFENVNGSVYLNPQLYPILERITKKGGEIFIILPYHCKRLIIPMTRNTKWGEQVQDQLRQQIYENPNYDEGNTRITLILKN